MLAEQGIETDVAGVVSARALAGSASDGRGLRGLLDFTRDPRVTDYLFGLIVSTQLQDAARGAASVAIAARPKVNWRGPGVYKEDGEELTFVGKDFPTETKGRSMYRKLFTNPADQ
jgi:hypothetical protein